MSGSTLLQRMVHVRHFVMEIPSDSPGGRFWTIRSEFTDEHGDITDVSVVTREKPAVPEYEMELKP